MKCYHVIMLLLYIDKSRLQGILQCFYRIYPKNFLSWEFSISMQNMVSYDLLLFMIKKLNLDRRNKLHATPRFPPGSFPVHIGDHLRFGIICGPIWGSFPVWSGIICGAVNLSSGESSTGSCPSCSLAMLFRIYRKGY